MVNILFTSARRRVELVQAFERAKKRKENCNPKRRSAENTNHL